METELDSESISKPSTVPSCLNNTNHDASNFECNICFELAQDAIITLCGHLFCWPCLYKWLHLHSHSHECPVCKALIEEDKLVPIYGRGTTNSDPRSWSRPGVEIPKRPTGQRPETVPTFHANPFPQQEVRFMPIETLRGVSFMLTIVGGGIFPALFPVLIGFQMLRFSDAAGYGTIMGFQYGGIDSFHGGHAQVSNQHSSREQQYYDSMSRLRYTLLLFGLAVLGFLCFR